MRAWSEPERACSQIFPLRTEPRLARAPWLPRMFPSLGTSMLAFPPRNCAEENADVQDLEHCGQSPDGYDRRSSILGTEIVIRGAQTPGQRGQASRTQDDRSAE